MRVLSLARERGERGREADALRLLGDVAAHRERLDVTAAGGFYSQALALASELGMHPLVAHCHLGLRTLAGRTGDRAKAEAHLTTATAMYREMGMDFWLEKAATVINRRGTHSNRVLSAGLSTGVAHISLRERVAQNLAEIRATSPRSA